MEIYHRSMTYWASKKFVRLLNGGKEADTTKGFVELLVPEDANIQQAQSLQISEIIYNII